MPKIKQPDVNYLDNSPKKKKILGLSEDSLKKLEKLVFSQGSEIVDHISTDESESECEDVPNKTDLKPKPAWDDSDCSGISFKDAAVQQGKVKLAYGDNVEYRQLLTQKFTAVYGTPKWAEVTRSKKENNILKRSGALLKKPTTLQKGSLNIKNLTNLNNETHYEGSIIKIVKFHPQSTVAMVGGLAGVVSLFQVGGKENTKLQSIQFERFPIYCASYLRQGEEIILGSHHHKYYYTHDLMSDKSIKIYNSESMEVTNMKKFVVSPDNNLIAVCGKFGFIYLISAASKEYIGFMKTNDEVLALSFSSDNSQLYSHTSLGLVYVWDVKSRELLTKFYDDGCLQGTCITASDNNQYLACGSSSGVVNIYELNKIFDKSPKPIKIIDNLITSISSLSFNRQSEILSIASDVVENAVKLLHFPSMTVFHNFPNSQVNHKRVQCTDFSVNSGFYAFGNNSGTAYLYSLKYYGNY